MIIAIAAATTILLIVVGSLAIRDRRIENIPCIAGWPLVGCLPLLGRTFAFTYLRWAEALNAPVFQMYLGSKIVVVVNSRWAAKKLWIDNMWANASRPCLYTFHKIVSQSQGYTIGTTPYNNDYKIRRRIVGRALNKPSIKSYVNVIDRECAICLDGISSKLKVSPEIQVHELFRTYALNTSLRVTYGIRLTDVDEALVAKIVHTEKQVSQCRSSASAWQDYVRLLQLLPLSLCFSSARRRAIFARSCRDEYMDMLLHQLVQQVHNKTAPPCITSNILQDIESGNTSCTLADLKSICLTMVSAGLDTIPAVLTSFIGHMSQPSYGLGIQEMAIRELERYYGSLNKAWYDCLTDDGAPYIRALVTETLRWSGLPISLPRETTADIEFQGATIPKGTMMLLNTFAVNFDPMYYQRPHQFDPERFLKSHNEKNWGPPHFSFGAGVRMCGGANLAYHEIYTAIVRLLCLYTILPPQHDEDRMPTNPFDIFMDQNSLAVEPPPFKVLLANRA
uniref:ARAD1D36190p n=1 Tax=Blastobotrys adeninivorans TaxID=409370 RepID=A0A060TH59_BLAAD